MCVDYSYSTSINLWLVEFCLLLLLPPPRPAPRLPKNSERKKDQNKTKRNEHTTETTGCQIASFSVIVKMSAPPSPNQDERDAMKANSADREEPSAMEVAFGGGSEEGNVRVVADVPTMR